MLSHVQVCQNIAWSDCLQWANTVDWQHNYWTENGCPPDSHDHCGKWSNRDRWLQLNWRILQDHQQRNGNYGDWIVQRIWSWLLFGIVKNRWQQRFGIQMSRRPEDACNERMCNRRNVWFRHRWDIARKHSNLWESVSAPYPTWKANASKLSARLFE